LLFARRRVLTDTQQAAAEDRAASGTTIPEHRGARVSVRRRRSSSRRRYSAAEWSIRSSRRRTARTVFVCTGVLLLMAMGLYFGLSHQESSPAEGASGRGPALAMALT
jgi:hypothetical protein